MKTTFAQKNPKTGLIEIIDVETGRVLAVQTSESDLLAGKRSELVETNIDGKMVYLEKGLSADRVVGKLSRPFSQVIGDIICQEIREGTSIPDILKKPGYPNYSTFTRWRTQNEDFDNEVKLAIRDRAEIRAERALKVAEEAETRDGNPDYALHVNTLKWAAEKDNPERFGKQIKHTGDADAPLVWHINTGIAREEDLPEPVEIEGEVVDADAQELPDSPEKSVGGGDE